MTNVFRGCIVAAMREVLQSAELRCAQETARNEQCVYLGDLKIARNVLVRLNGVRNVSESSVSRPS